MHANAQATLNSTPASAHSSPRARRSETGYGMCIRRAQTTAQTQRRRRVSTRSTHRRTALIALPSSTNRRRHRTGSPGVRSEREGQDPDTVGVAFRVRRVLLMWAAFAILATVGGIGLSSAAGAASPERVAASVRPTGTIIYVCAEPLATALSLCSIRADGTARRVLRHDVGPDTAHATPSLSSDGRRLVFVSGRRAYAADAQARGPVRWGSRAPTPSRLSRLVNAC